MFCPQFAVLLAGSNVGIAPRNANTNHVKRSGLRCRSGSYEPTAEWPFRVDRDDSRPGAPAPEDYSSAIFPANLYRTAPVGSSVDRMTTFGQDIRCTLRHADNVAVSVSQ